jgi:CheY-like chemotaxis protein
MIEKNREKPRILLVDDNPLWRHVFSVGLSRYGTIDTASSLSQAYEAAYNRPYELWVLDQNLSDGTGQEFAEHFEGVPDRPFILMNSTNCIGGGKNEQFDALVRNGIIDGYTGKEDCEETVKGFRLRMRERMGYSSDKPVLIVENEYNEGLITPIFERSGLEFDVVESGFEAIYTYQEKEYGTVVIALPSFGARGARTVLSLAEVDSLDLIGEIRKFERENKRKRASLYSLHDIHEGYNIKFDVRVCNRDSLVSLLRERFPRVRTSLIIDPNERWGTAVAEHLEGKFVDGVKIGGAVYVGDSLKALRMLEDMRPGRVFACPDQLNAGYSGDRLTKIALGGDRGARGRTITFGGLKRKNPDASPAEIIDALRLKRL